MIPIAKLAKLSPRHRLRKAALVLADVERRLLAPAPRDYETTAAYAAALAAMLRSDPQASERLKLAAAAVVGAGPVGSPSAEPAKLLRAVDSLRHLLMDETGQAPADWDLIDPATGRAEPGDRRIVPGVRVYLEDIRSPFNVGSIFRTADAFGVEEVVLSPATADPGHPRAARSAMGAVALVPWRRAELEALEADGPAFALELGGADVGEFAFPRRGIVVLGSEELGVSAEALARCGLGRVSIPMSGVKGSLNAAVAFGILMYAWTRAIAAE